MCYNYLMADEREEQKSFWDKVKSFFGSKWHYLVVFIFGAVLSVGVWSYVTQINDWR